MSDALGEVPMPRGAPPEEVLRVVASALELGRAAAVATVVARRGSAPSTPGQKLALICGDASREALGSVGGGAVELAVLRALDAMLDDSGAEPKIETFRLGPTLGMCCGGSVDIVLEPLRSPIHVLIVGAGHVGVATAPLLASLGFRVTVADAREEAAQELRFPELPSASASGPVRVLFAAHDDPEVAAALPHSRDRVALLTMSHDHALDQAVIEWGLVSGFGFVGGVGSRAKAARTAARLQAKGIATSDISRVRMPIGAPIGARSPAEIAVSIAAELVAWRAARSAQCS